MSQTQLYRHFDTSGALLYVGISLSSVSRLSQHRDSSAWFDKIAKVTVEAFPTRHDALIAEAAAIANENPKYNIARPSSDDILRLERAKRLDRAARIERRMTAKQVEAATKPGSYGDGGGLTIEVDSAGRRYWFWRYRRAGKRREMSLGSPDDVTLAEARGERDRWRKVLRNGGDPIDVRRTEKHGPQSAAETVTISMANLVAILERRGLDFSGQTSV